MAGAAQEILCQLADHGLISAAPVVYQSTRHSAYEAALQQLQEKNRVFLCSCTRAQQQQAGRSGCVSDCAQQPRTEGAWRLRPAPLSQPCVDARYGVLPIPAQADVVLKRRDGLIAYPLAVVVDDAAHGVTEVVRGEDLLSSTYAHCLVQEALALPRPTYRHVPVVRGPDGRKLSKQNQAPALQSTDAVMHLRSALSILGQPCPPAAAETPAQLLDWATAHWNAASIPAPHDRCYFP